MTIHREGYTTVLFTFLILFTINFFVLYYFPDDIVTKIITLVLSMDVMGLVLFFFRSPNIIVDQNPNHIISPADGKIVAIEQVEESEYFKDTRIQISIFMSPLDVHLNRYPIGGKITYTRYHSGSYLVAWHPKSSSENERSTVVVDDGGGNAILVRQIAGAVARRIVPYSKMNQAVVQGDELGFIKFGSRVDLFLPLHSKLLVNMNDRVKAGQTILGRFS
jgi:phosphatidylserine decarboxylase